MLLDAVDAVLAGEPGRSVEIALPVPVPRSYLARVEPLAIAPAPAGRAEAAGRATVLVDLHDLTAVQPGARKRAGLVAHRSRALRPPHLGSASPRVKVGPSASLPSCAA